MLFTTYAFVFAFLPVVFGGFFLIARRSTHLSAVWLFLASMFFYAYWMPQYALLLFGSICFNFWVGKRIATLVGSGEPGRKAARLWLIVGIVADLSLLAYYKYANFFIGTVNETLGARLPALDVILPIGISFFSFTQIAFLADAYQKGIREYRFAHYGLFVTYFPHLIAGPVLHHAQLMPQLSEAKTYRINARNIAIGLTLFGIGLFKKVVVADGISPFADAVFNPVDAGEIPTLVEAWIGAVAYTFQLYFDFSGYSDMAIGLSWLFNIRLPFNFNSPYKAAHISDFWRRWHISLSTFLRDYLYVPLGGNRKGPVRRYFNLLITMLLGGLWHGASWTFVFWGGLHGVYLVIHHAFKAFVTDRFPVLERSKVYAASAWAVTFLAVVVAWVFFRATQFGGAQRMISAMANLNTGETLNGLHPLLWNEGLRPESALVLLLILLATVVLMPNTNEIGETLRRWMGLGSKRVTESMPAPAVVSGPVLASQNWAAALTGAMLVVGVLLVVINESRKAVSAFIYFNF